MRGGRMGLHKGTDFVCGRAFLVYTGEAGL
jgi:hypothetical protein